MNKPIVLFRPDNSNWDEFDISSKYLETVINRTSCKDCLVIPRYSALPYFRELCEDLDNLGSYPINSWAQHNWIANFNYYEVLEKYTFKTYTDQDFYLAPEGKYIVKGRTNSRKFQWNRQMFAENKRVASHIAAELAQDSLIGPQGILYREYVELETFEYGLNDLPFTNEWRFFFYKSNLLSCGYYWSIAENILTEPPTSMVDWAKDLAIIIADGEFANFFVLDVATTKSGEFILVEVNDGMMSGLSECDANLLYFNLSQCLEKENE